MRLESPVVVILFLSLIAAIWVAITRFSRLGNSTARLEERMSELERKKRPTGRQS
jgi:hypothetical protein